MSLKANGTAISLPTAIRRQARFLFFRIARPTDKYIDIESICIEI